MMKLNTKPLKEQIQEESARFKRKFQEDLVKAANLQRDHSKLVDEQTHKNKRTAGAFANLDAKHEAYLKKKHDRDGGREQRVKEFLKKRELDLEEHAQKIITREQEAMEKIRLRRELQAANRLEELDGKVAEEKKKKAERKKIQMENLQVKMKERTDHLMKKRHEAEERQRILAEKQEAERKERVRNAEEKRQDRVRKQTALKKKRDEEIDHLKEKLAVKAKRSERVNNVKNTAKELTMWKNSQESRLMSDMQASVFTRLKETGKLHTISNDDFEKLSLLEICGRLGVKLTPKETANAKKWGL